MASVSHGSLGKGRAPSPSPPPSLSSLPSLPPDIPGVPFDNPIRAATATYDFHTTPDARPGVPGTPIQDIRPDGMSVKSFSESGNRPPSVAPSTWSISPPRGSAAFITKTSGDKGNAGWIIRAHKRNLIHPISTKTKSSEPAPGSEPQEKPNDAGEEEAQNTRSKPWVRPDPQGESFRIRLVELQRMHLRKLQCRLVRHAIHMSANEEEPANWESDLKDYTKAYQDYEYMVGFSQLPWDPFYVTGERKTDAFVIHTTLDKMKVDLKSNDLDKPIKTKGPWEEEWNPIGGARDMNVARKWRAGFKERLTVAAYGGFFLIGPMWLMVLRNRLYTTLVSATVFVVFFGIIMAWKVSDPKDVMSTTAAYAAVLVVFVGLTMTDEGGKDQPVGDW